MKSKTRFIPLVVLGALVMSLLLILPVFSATGTIKIVDSTNNANTLSWSRQGTTTNTSTITVEVADSDLNVSLAVSGEATSSSGGYYYVPDGTSANALLPFKVQKAPFNTGAASDITVTRSQTTITISVFTVTSQEDGTFQLLVSSAPAASTTAQAIDAAAAVGATSTEIRGASTHFNVGDIVRISSGGTDQDRKVTSRSSGGDGQIGGGDDVIGFDVPLTSAVAVGATITNLGESFTVTYTGSGTDNTGTAVKVTSQADPSGITVQLTESTPTSGVFRADVLLDDSVSTTTGSNKLKVGKNDIVTAKYTDASPSQTVSTTVKVETTDPGFANFSPSNGTAGKDARPDLEADITDSDSGLSDTSVTLLIGRDDDGDGTIDATPAPEAVNVKSNGDLTTITGGLRAKQRVPSSLAPTTDATFYWWLRAVDIAGNVGVSDRQTTIDNAADACNPDAFPSTGAGLVGLTVGTSSSVNGCQPYSVKVDFTAPTIDTANTKTGPWWDTSKTTTDKTETDVTKAKNTSIRVDFSENLDASTVTASDFRVDGVAPTAAEHFSGNANSVFLTVPALASNARPKVELVSQIKDVAGNEQTSGTVSAAVDGIAPALTVTLTGTASSRPVTNGKVTIAISADEDVSQPTVAIQKVVNTSTTTTAALAAASNVTPTFKTARSYEASFTAPSTGLWNVYVTAADSNQGNVGTKGVTKGAIDLTDSSSALLFEFDNAVGAAAIGPATTDDASTFITVSFTAEGSEYTDTAVTGSTGGVDIDSHDTVTITSFSVGGTSIATTSLATSDNKQFLYKPTTPLSVADHTVKVKAKDSAGNETEFSGTVKITERKPFGLKLNPGWNMVSIPGEPADSDINTVIPASHPASQVLTYDPSVPGGWLVAIRDTATGQFAGTLSSITAGRAYWILTTSFESVNVSIPRLSSGTANLPPTVSIVEGWNFVPVLDVTGNLAHAATINTGTYFSGLKLTRAYTFNTVTNTWTQVTISTVAGNNVAIGSGYWVYATEAGTLVP